MNRFVTLVLVFVGMNLLAGCATLESPDHMVVAAKDLDQRFCKEFSEGDVEEVMQMYWNSPELVVISPDGAISTGWAAARDMFARMFAATPGAKLEITDSHYRVEGGVIYGWGTWRMIMPAKPGIPAVEVRGCYSEIDARRDGKMVYILDHPAMILPPAAPVGAQSR
jgi:ketosteroid isomerase-like protein